jgi:NADH:ubiquinone oxidoreductase subunit 2 (subunit N)
MDYITIYLILATVILLLIVSLIQISSMDALLVRTEETLSRSDKINQFSMMILNKKNQQTNDSSSTISVGTHSAAILGNCLFLLVNFAYLYARSETLVDITPPVIDVTTNIFWSLPEGSPSQEFIENLALPCISSWLSTTYKIFRYLLLLLAFIVVISVRPYILETHTSLLVLLSTIGILLMATSCNFITFYLALELISLASYILVSTTISLRDDNGTIDINNKTEASHKNYVQFNLVYAKNSILAGLNYFLLSALSSGLLVLGISLIYLSTGELDFNSLARIFSCFPYFITQGLAPGNLNPQDYYQPSVQSGIGIILVMTFVLFKLGASPFHYWVADVYEKVSIFVNYFLIVVSKLGMLFALMKLSFGMNLPLVVNFLIVASVSSLIIGSFAGLVQTKLRRLMAFSSINHVGYILLAYSFSLTKFTVNNLDDVKLNEFDFTRDNHLGEACEPYRYITDFQLPMIITEFSKSSIASLWLYIVIYTISTVSFFAILSLAISNQQIMAKTKNLILNFKNADTSPLDTSGSLAPQLNQEDKWVKLDPNLTLQRLNSLDLLNIKPKNETTFSSKQNVLTFDPIFVSVSLTITLLSLAGVPPLAGFIAKVAIFWQVLDSGNWLLATAAVLCSVISAIYYLRIVAFLYFVAPRENKGALNMTHPLAGTAPQGKDLQDLKKLATVSLPKINKQKTVPATERCSGNTFLTALIVSTITITLVVFPILNPSFMYLYMMG